MESSSEFDRLQRLLSVDPWSGWDDFRSFVAGEASLLTADALLEDLLDTHGAEFMDAIEAEAEASPRFAEAVAHADISEMGDPRAIERIRRLQRRLRDQLGVSYWEGWLPIEPIDPRDIPER